MSHIAAVAQERRYGVEELAELGGVSRRTVRYYVQEGLIPEPLGVGRGSHYDESHLGTLLRVKELQEHGLSLDHIRHVLAGRAAEPSAAPAPRRSSWTRIELLPGLELHVGPGAKVPSPGRLSELSDWCRRHVRRSEDDHE